IVVESGVADRARLVLAGRSWGGYLTLLGLGTQPDLWSLGIAEVPRRRLPHRVRRRDGASEGVRPRPLRRLARGASRFLPRALAADARRPGARSRLHHRGRARSPLPGPSDRQLRRRAAGAGAPPRGLPLPGRPRLAGGRRADPPARSADGVRISAPRHAATPVVGCARVDRFARAGAAAPGRRSPALG